MILTDVTLQMEELYYDSNGTGSGGTYVLFAKVDANITLTASDFLVI